MMWMTFQVTNSTYNEMLNNFLEERAKSIAWLKSLETPNWEIVTLPFYLLST